MTLVQVLSGLLTVLGCAGRVDAAWDSPLFGVDSIHTYNGFWDAPNVIPSSQRLEVNKKKRKKRKRKQVVYNRIWNI